MNEEDLLNLKKEIESAKTEVNQLEGEKKGLEKQLLEEWKCKSLKEAKKKLQDLKDQIIDKETKIKEGTAELEEKYEFE